MHVVARHLLSLQARSAYPSDIGRPIWLAYCFNGEGA